MPWIYPRLLLSGFSGHEEPWVLITVEMMEYADDHSLYLIRFSRSKTVVIGVKPVSQDPEGRRIHGRRSETHQVEDHILNPLVRRFSLWVWKAFTHHITEAKPTEQQCPGSMSILSHLCWMNEISRDAANRPDAGASWLINWILISLWFLSFSLRENQVG